MKIFNAFKQKMRKTGEILFSRGKSKSQTKLSEFFRNSPLAGIELSRDKSLPRGSQRGNAEMDNVLK